MIMFSLRLTLGQKKQCGGYTIRIAINFKKSTCYIATPYSVERESQLDGSRVVRHSEAAYLNRQLQELLHKYEDRAAAMDGCYSSCRELKEILLSTDREKRYTVTDALEHYVAELERQERYSYAKILKTDCSKFVKLMGNIPLNGITPAVIEKYSTILNHSGVSIATRVKLMRSLKVIVNYAIKQQMVSFEIHPFLRYRIAASPVRRCDIDAQQLNKIINFMTPSRRLAVARDAFLLSFYLGGINFYDLVNVDFRKGYVEYVRKKTAGMSGTLISFGIVDAARPIIDKYMGKDGRLDFGYNFSSYVNLLSYIDRHLYEIALKLGIERLMYYTARKSFAQLAAELGISDAVINYCLGHSDSSRGVIRYYTRVRARQADAAIKMVVEYAHNPAMYDDKLNECYKRDAIGSLQHLSIK